MLTPDTRSHSHRYQCHDITSHSATSVDRWKSFVHVLKSTALFHCSLNCCSEVWMSFEINSTGNTLVVSLPVSCFHGKNLFLINQCRASSSLIYAILIRLLQIERKCVGINKSKLFFRSARRIIYAIPYRFSIKVKVSGFFFQKCLPKVLGYHGCATNNTKFTRRHSAYGGYVWSFKPFLKFLRKLLSIRWKNQTYRRF